MARPDSGLPRIYPLLTALGFTIVMVLFVFGTAHRHVWVLTVVFGLAALYGAYATFTWFRGMVRARRRAKPQEAPSGN